MWGWEEGGGCRIFSKIPADVNGLVFVSLQIAWFLQITMGTTATETLAVAGNIFVGMVSTLRISDLPFSGEQRIWQKTG